MPKDAKMPNDMVMNELQPSCSKGSMSKQQQHKSSHSYDDELTCPEPSCPAFDDDDETTFNTTTTMMTTPKVTSLSFKDEVQLTEVVTALVGHQITIEAMEPPVKPPMSKNKLRLLRLLEQVRSRHTWTVMMVSLGTLYMLTNIWNIQQLWDGNLKYELVVGPPMFVMKILLTVFTTIGTIAWIFELVNILLSLLILSPMSYG